MTSKLSCWNKCADGMPAFSDYCDWLFTDKYDHQVILCSIPMVYILGYKDTFYGDLSRATHWRLSEKLPLQK
jgi:hypothetical protein